MVKDEEKKKPKGKEEKKEKPPVSDDDLEKTRLDVDISQMEDMDETVIVRAPVDEDSGFHEVPFFDEEQTDKHAVRQGKRAKTEGPAGEEKPPSPPLGEQAEKPKKKEEEEKTAVPRHEAKEASPEKIRAEPEPGHFSFLFLGLSGLVFLLLAAGLLEAMRKF